MEENYADLIKEKSNYRSQRADRYKVDSKDRLSKIMRKKIETTMIGALSTIEDRFGFLWGKDQEEPLTDEQEIMRELYNSVRSEILDRGNNQARNIDAELGQYEVEWKKYSMTIPVISKDN